MIKNRTEQQPTVDVSERAWSHFVIWLRYFTDIVIEFRPEEQPTIDVSIKVLKLFFPFLQNCWEGCFWQQKSFGVIGFKYFTEIMIACWKHKKKKKPTRDISNT